MRWTRTRTTVMAVTVAAVAFTAGAVAVTASDPFVPFTPRVVQVKDGDGLSRFAARWGVTVQDVVSSNPWLRSDGLTLLVGDELQLPAHATATPILPTTTVPATTTTVAPATTTTSTLPAPTTTVPATTVPSTTTSSTTTTTSVPDTPAGFVETFDTAASLANWTATVSNGQNFFDRPTSWQADHNLACGGVGTSRTINWPELNDNIPDVRPAGDTFYWCAPGNPDNGHVMTSFHTKGYAHLDFTPSRTFTDVSRVCFDVNATNLGNRKWLQLAVVPVSVADSVAPRLDWTHPGFRADGGPASWGLPVTSDVFMYSTTQGNAEMFGSVSGSTESIGTAAADKATRYTTCVEDIDGGVRLTRNLPNGLTNSQTFPGGFPDGEVKVVFQDVSYDPDKAESPPAVAGGTWHWSNVEIL